ncbi:MAG TPA: hypothetical protein VKZ53_23625 [Candidatus Angelobacter sp.]|nr:hypothetical protein [Candidatus Angelobacter sp.]
MLGTSGALGAQEAPTGDRLKQVLGLKPLGNNASVAEREMARVVHEWLTDLSDARKQHDATMAELQPVLAKLYTPDSFSTKEQMQALMDTLNRMQDTDGAMFEKFEHILEDMRKRFDASHLSAKDKIDVLEGAQRAYADSELLELYREAHSQEKLWVSTSIDLYTFAMQHGENISIREGKLTISGAELVEQFNSKLHNASALRRQMRATNKRIGDIRAEKMKQLGVTNSDLGLPEKSTR